MCGIFVNHGDDENCQTLAAMITEQFGIQAEAPWSGSCFDLLRNEWVDMAQPVEKKKEVKQHAPAKNKDYLQLVAAAEALLRYAKSLEHHANSEMRHLTKKIAKLIEEE